MANEHLVEFFVADVLVCDRFHVDRERRLCGFFAHDLNEALGDFDRAVVGAGDVAPDPFETALPRIDEISPYLRLQMLRGGLRPLECAARLLPPAVPPSYA